LGPAPWQSGEVSEYQVKDVNGNPAGIASALINAASDESAAWLVQRSIDVGSAQEQTVATLNSLYSPVTSVLTRTIGTERQIVKANYQGSQVQLELTSAQNVTTYDRRSITSDAYENATLFALLRTLPRQEGYAARINVFSPSPGVQETFVVHVIEREQITVPAGVYETWKLELTTNNNTTTAWVSEQAPHPLVKYEDGRIQATFELASFEPGSGNR